MKETLAGDNKANKLEQTRWAENKIDVMKILSYKALKFQDFDPFV